MVDAASAKDESAAKSPAPAGEVTAARSNTYTRGRSGRGFAQQPGPATAIESREAAVDAHNTPSSSKRDKTTVAADVVGATGGRVAGRRARRVRLACELYRAKLSATRKPASPAPGVVADAPSETAEPANETDRMYFYRHYGAFEAEGTRMMHWLFTPFRDATPAPASQPNDSRMCWCGYGSSRRDSRRRGHPKLRQRGRIPMINSGIIS